MINSLDFEHANEFPSFISEGAIDSWMLGVHGHVIKVGKSIRRLFTMSSAGASIFASFAGYAAGIADAAAGIVTGVIVFVVILLFPAYFSFSSVVYYVKFSRRERHGIWIGVFTCTSDGKSKKDACDGNWVKALDNKEIARCRGKEESFIENCPTCGKIDGMDGVLIEETCGKCKMDRMQFTRCSACKGKLYLSKLYQKKIGDVHGRTQEGNSIRHDTEKDPAGGIEAARGRKKETGGRIKIAGPKVGIDID
jgi:hypothetical protein